MYKNNQILMPDTLLPILPFIFLAFQANNPQHADMPLEKSVLVPLHQCVWRQGEGVWEVAIGMYRERI